MITPEIKDFISRHIDEDVRKVALLKNPFSKEQFLFALQQIEGRQIAKKKLPSWYQNGDLLYPPHLSLEQCSSEMTARYKASLLNDSPSSQSYADLTGGLGVDFSFMACQFQEAFYVERNPLLCELASHNFPLLDLPDAKIVNGSADSFVKDCVASGTHFDQLFLDPARRDARGNKVISIRDCEPDVSELKKELLQISGSIWIKYSPMLDISLACKELEDVSDIHVVSVQNECKELLLHLSLSSQKSLNPTIYCVNLKKNGSPDLFSFTYEQESLATLSIAESIGHYLYEPSASIMKAGGFKSLSEKFRVPQLDVSSHLYTSDILYADFPGRTFLVEKVFTMNKNELAGALKDCEKANISVRNFPLSAENLRKKLKLKDGGNTYIFGTNYQNKNILIKCIIVE